VDYTRQGLRIQYQEPPGYSQFLCHVERSETSLTILAVWPKDELRFFASLRMTQAMDFMVLK
jgi:hypothetical protein